MVWKLFERAGRLADGFVGLLGNRLSLFGLELQEEIERLLGYLASLLVIALFAGLALICASAAVLVFAAQHDWLLPASIILAALYVAAASLSAYGLWRCLQRAPEPFAATRAEFERDRLSLNSKEELEP